MWVPSLGQEDPPEEEMATHSSILAWRIPWTRGQRSLAGYSPWSHTRVRQDLKSLGRQELVTVRDHGEGSDFKEEAEIY